MNDRQKFDVRPLYLQVRDVLAARVASKEWQPGHVIPNEVDLASDFGVSVGTMRKAFDVLVAEKIITRRQGRGTYVIDPNTPNYIANFSGLRDADGAIIDDDCQELTRSEAKPDAIEQSRLKVSASTAIYCVRWLCKRNRRPYMVEQACYPAHFFPGLLQRDTISRNIVTLGRDFGIFAGRRLEIVVVDKTDGPIAERLGLNVGDPIMKLQRIVANEDGKPIEYRTSFCNPTRLSYHSLTS